MNRRELRQNAVGSIRAQARHLNVETLDTESALRIWDGLAATSANWFAAYYVTLSDAAAKRIATEAARTYTR